MDTTALQDTKTHSKLPLILSCALVGVLAAGYLGLCGYASTLQTFYPNSTINGVDVSGLTAQAAQQTLEQALPRKAVVLYEASNEAEETAPQTLASVTLDQLGYTDKSLIPSAAQSLLGLQQQNRSFFTGGWQFLQSLTGSTFPSWVKLTLDEGALDETVQTLAASLNQDPIHGSYTLNEDSISIVKAKDGHNINEATLREDLILSASSGSMPLYRVDVAFTNRPAKEITVDDIYAEVSSEMKNAGYDSETNSITPEQVGADFDFARAQQLLDAADPGQTIEVSATIQRPAVTADELEKVLFRDILGTYTTHVGGTAARISNVKLSAGSINGIVLNSGDVFDYNQVVGQRTAARGYQAAPAYVKGETVDEIGGGICQTSSTLYLACLKSNLEIVERYAHRYVPAYIPKGMDATVSWGGPNYQFRNDTDYPIKVEAVYSKNYLTITLYGTKVDDITVKMTNKVLATIPFEVVYEDDPTLPAGKEAVKTTPYTGYQVETYRNLYDGAGNLISSTFEATSNYKSRNRVILRGPALPEVPAGGDASITTPTDPVIPVTPDTPVSPETPTVPETPVTPDTPTTPTTPETPVTPDPAQSSDPSAVISPLPAP